MSATVMPAAVDAATGTATDAPLTVAERIIAALSRVTSSGRNIAWLDGLRGAALLWVILHHLNAYLAYLAAVPFVAEPVGNTLIGALTVAPIHALQMFYVMSGFILGVPFAEQHFGRAAAVPLRGYYWRRITRIEPPYFINLILMMGLLLATNRVDGGTLWPHGLASLFYVHNAVYGTPSTVNVVAWSLEIEVQFYLIAPLVAHLYRLPPIARRAAFGAGIVAFPLLQVSLGLSKLSILGQAQFFLMGLLLADLFLNDLPRFGSRTFWDVLGGLSVLGPMMISSHWVPGKLLVPLFVLAVFLAGFRGSILPWVLSNRWLVMIGATSYSIYLFHYQVIALVGRFSRGLRITDYYLPNLLLQFAVMMPAVLAVSFVYFLLIEKPCMRKDWPTRLRRRLASLAWT